MMTSERRFQKNLELWSRMCPKQSVMLPYLDTTSLEECVTTQGEPNLRKKGKEGKPFFLHSQKGAADEASDWFSSLDLEGVELICVYGVGLGYYYDAAEAWLKKSPKHFLVFLEDDLMVLRILLETERGTRILKNPRVQLLHFYGLKADDSVFDVLYWNFAQLPFTISALRSYEDKKKTLYSDFKHKLAYDFASKNALIDEYMRYGASFYINFYQNMLRLPESYLGSGLFGKFAKVPAIICGAGPSLSKNISLLSQLSDKALIFAGGSAVNALNAAGCQPHFGAGIDPNPMQLERLRNNQAYEVPFFYRSRMNHQAFQAIDGPRLYIPGTGGYDTAEYFEKKFRIDREFFDEGHNVINFCVQLAHAMGCSPIIFVGMDLAFTGKLAYAPGVEKTVVSKPDLLRKLGDVEQVIEKKDIFGNPITTVWKWVSESDWIGTFAQEHPSVPLYNCTEGGLGFPGVDNRPLAEIAGQHLIRHFELQDRIHGETQNNKMSKVTYSKITKAMKELAQSLGRINRHFSVLVEETKKIREILKGGGPLPERTSGRAALAETELTEEPAYKYVLDMFNEVYARTLSREGAHSRMRGLSLHRQWNKKTKIALKKYTFLNTVTVVNKELINYAFKENKFNAASKPVGSPVALLSQKKKTTYQFKNKRIKISDPDLHIEIDVPFDPILIPNKPVDGTEIKPHYFLRVSAHKKSEAYECFVEYQDKPHGQCLLFYSNGHKKMETFYKNGLLHGPATFWNINGQVISESWFLDGLRCGKSYWYYASGNLYSVQTYRNNVRDGLQTFFYENGTPKTILLYKQGKIEQVILNSRIHLGTVQ